MSRHRRPLRTQARWRDVIRRRYAHKQAQEPVPMPALFMPEAMLQTISIDTQHVPLYEHIIKDVAQLVEETLEVPHSQTIFEYAQEHKTQIRQDYFKDYASQDFDRVYSGLLAHALRYHRSCAPRETAVDTKYSRQREKTLNKAAQKYKQGVVIHR